MDAHDLRVFPFHSMAFQPAVRDDTGDHCRSAGAGACLHDVDERGEGVFRAIEVVKSHEVTE